MKNVLEEPSATSWKKFAGLILVGYAFSWNWIQNQNEIQAKTVAQWQGFSNIRKRVRARVPPWLERYSAIKWVIFPVRIVLHSSSFSHWCRHDIQWASRCRPEASHRLPVEVHVRDGWLVTFMNRQKREKKETKSLRQFLQLEYGWCSEGENTDCCAIDYLLWSFQKWFEIERFSHNEEILR